MLREGTAISAGKVSTTLSLCNRCMLIVWLQARLTLSHLSGDDKESSVCEVRMGFFHGIKEKISKMESIQKPFNLISPTSLYAA